MINNGSLFLCIAAALVFVGFINVSEDDEMKSLDPPEMKNTGGFYSGIYLPEVDETLSYEPVAKKTASFKTSFDIVSFYQAWGPESIEKFPEKLMKDVAKNNGIPMITWEPWAVTFPEFEWHRDLSKDKKICKAIFDGLFDDYLKKYSDKIRAYGDPVFIRFAHEADNPAYPWSASGGNTAEEYIAAWQHVVSFFDKAGVSNVTWVWTPWSKEGLFKYFPGGQYVDWIGVTCLNYGTASRDGKWRSFEEVYTPYRDQLLQLKRPIMLAEFGTTSYGGDQKEWMADAMQKINDKYTEIKSAVFFYSDKDKNWVTPWRPKSNDSYINWRFKNEEMIAEVVRENLKGEHYSDKPFSSDGYAFLPKVSYNKTSSKFYTGEPGNYSLLVHNKPFYIQGVAYNTAHDWRDGNIPLTRRQILKDFDQMKAMGANAVRRYSPGIYDDNIVQIASEMDLKVLYGFWFDPKVDYYKDTKKIQEYIDEVEKVVKKYKNSNSIFAWSIGNEAWGLLKHQYAKPYLTKVRKEYVKMIEHLAQRIHEIDPSRPVITAFEHEEYQLPGEIAAFKDDAPSIDIIGVNSYYEEQISKLQEICYTMDSLRPYIVSEFGPKGYWNPKYSKFNKENLLQEDDDLEKGSDYQHQWKEHISKNKGYNIGGFAFCWHDRMEGTNTWFGLNDYKGRLKPAYYALKETWTGKKEATLPDVDIVQISKTIKAGKEVEFTVNNKGDKNYKYEWQLFKNDYWKHIKEVKVSEQGNSATIIAPEPNAKYRLYLYASDENGKVVTASHAFIAN